MSRIENLLEIAAKKIGKAMQRHKAATIVVTVIKGLKPQYNPQPTTIPIINDRLTSFVIKLMIIARIGGINAQKVDSMYFLSTHSLNRIKIRFV